MFNLYSNSQKQTNSDDLSEAAPLKLAKYFVEEFEVGATVGKYNAWCALDLVEIEGELSDIITKLKDGDVEASTRKKLRITRDRLKHDITTLDPRTFRTQILDEWMLQHSLVAEDASRADLNQARSQVRMMLCQAVNNSETYLASGLIPFMIDFENSPDHFKVKTIADFTRDSMNAHGIRSENTLRGKKALIKKNLELMEEYDEVPDDIKMMANIYIEHSLEFSIRVARLQDEMLKSTLQVFNRGKSDLLALTADNA